MFEQKIRIIVNRKVFILVANKPEMIIALDSISLGEIQQKKKFIPMLPVHVRFSKNVLINISMKYVQQPLELDVQHPYQLSTTNLDAS